MKDELLYTGKRFLDLSKQASRKGIVTFSDFLSLSEQAVLAQNSPKLETRYELSGGYDYAERQMAAFIPDALFHYGHTETVHDTSDADKPEYPFRCLRITPSYPKFAEKLTHRDALGALMSLGIERSKIGDLMVDDDNMLFFAQNSIVAYLMDNLSVIRHTAVSLTASVESHISFEPRFEECEAIVSSNRLDAVIAAICKTSRNAALKLITEGKVFVNGAQTLHHTYDCKQGDILSIRGFGKVRFGEILGVTKKDRLKFSYKIYS